MTNHEDSDNPIFGVICPNLHTTYFDKRDVCPDLGVVVRRLVDEEGKTLDRLILTCGTCDAEIVVQIDCEGYK